MKNYQIVSVEACQHLNVFGGDLSVLLEVKNEHTDLTLYEQLGMPGYGVAPHVHTNEDEIFEVREGQVEFLVGEEVTVAGPGTTIYVPRKTPHAFRVVGTSQARIYITVTPGTLTGMFEELSTLSMPINLQAVSEICGRYGISFLPASVAE